MTRGYRHNPELAASVGQAVRLRRRAKNWTLRDLAERVPCSTATLSVLERGEGNILLDMLWSIAGALDCRLIHLLPTESRVSTRLFTAREIAAVRSVAEKLDALSRSRESGMRA